MAVTINGDGVVDVGGNASSAAYVRLYEDSDNGTNYVDLIAPASVASNRTITLPDNTGTMLTSASSITASQLPAGSVLQVVAADLTNTTTSDTSTGTSAPTWGSATLTPTKSGNYIVAIVSGSCQYQTACLGESFAYLTYSASGVSEAVTSQIVSGNETSSLRTYDGFGITGRITTSTTNTYTIRVRVNGKDVYGTGRSVSWTNGRLILMEVAS